MPTLEELTTPLTREEIEASIYASIEARGVETTSWKEGAIVRTIITGAAVVLAAYSKLAARIAESGFLELSESDWLSLTSRFVYGVERNQGTFASGEVVFSNTGGLVFSFGVGDVVVINPTGVDGGKSYRNTAPFSLNAFESNVVVPVQALELGSDSNALSGAINTLETALTGVTVTNPSALVGEDPETDPQLRARCLAKLGTLSPNGPRAAYRFQALSARTTGGIGAGVTRVTTIADGTGHVAVYVATGSGGVTGVVGDPSTPLGAVDVAIRELVLPVGVSTTIASATPLVLAVTYEVWVRSTIGLTASEVAAQVETALAPFVGQLPIGGLRKFTGAGSVYAELLEAAIGETIGAEHLVDLQLSVPAADVPVAPTEAPVLGVVTATVHLVAS